VPDGHKRRDIQIGQRVRIVEKQNQRTGKLTEGNVERILTGSPDHPHGIKVQLKGGAIGRVKEILASNHATPES
jgi:uncharacterized repeat protein (TIGR03833 family)